MTIGFNRSGPQAEQQDSGATPLPRVLRRESILRTNSNFVASTTRQGGWAATISFLKLGLLIVAVSFGTKFYVVHELLVVWGTLAVLFLLVTGILLFFVLVHECGMWSLRKFKAARQATVLSRRAPAAVGMHELALPSAVEVNPEVSLPMGLYGVHAKKRGC